MLDTNRNHTARKWATYGGARGDNALMVIGTAMMRPSEQLGTLPTRKPGKPIAECKGIVTPAVHTIVKTAYVSSGVLT